MPVDVTLNVRSTLLLWALRDDVCAAQRSATGNG